MLPSIESTEYSYDKLLEAATESSKTISLTFCIAIYTPSINHVE